MRSQNILWYVVLAMGTYYVYEQWVSPRNYVEPPIMSAPAFVPSTIPDQDILTLDTDKVVFKIQKSTGNIIGASLLDYPSVLYSGEMVNLLEADQDNPLMVRMSLDGGYGISDDQLGLNYSVVSWNESQLHLMATSVSGLMVEKIYQLPTQGLPENAYLINVSMRVTNNSNQVVSTRFIMEYMAQRIRALDSATYPKPSDFIAGSKESPTTSWFASNTFSGISYHNNKTAYAKVDYGKIALKPLNETVESPWLAIQKRYFVTAIIPQAPTVYQLNDVVVLPNQNFTMFSSWAEGKLPSINSFDQRMEVGLAGEYHTIQPNQTIAQEFKVFAGPEQSEILEKVANKLDLTIDFGIFWLLCNPLLWILKLAYKVTFDWGWSIVLVTLLLRALFYRMSEVGYVSMLKMKQVAPRIKHIQEKYEDDDMKKNQAILQLYRDEKINPLSGCLPAILPLPFMMALYYVLLEAIELRHVPFLWLSDLSSPDPTFLFPIGMTIAMYVQQSMTPVDDSQKPMMMVMPVMIGLMSLQFPSGLAMFYFVNTFSKCSAINNFNGGVIIATVFNNFGVIINNFNFSHINII
jgi:YidC/Oxa1 family membrane protein insertase